MATAARRVYKESYGMWARQSGRIRRPDWHYATIATARANLWRKLLKAHAAGRRALAIETDCVFFDATSPEWAIDAPPGFKLDASGLSLGTFKPGGTP